MWALALPGLIDRPKGLATRPAEASRANSAQLLQEWDLVHRAQQFENAALTSLYQTYYPKVYNYAHLQLGEVQAAEDLASEVMVKVLESLKDYRFTGTPFAAWVFRIARNRLIDLHRRRHRRGEVALSETLPSREASPPSLAERAMSRDEIRAALARLTEEQRQVIVLKFIEGFDNRSVAKVIGRSDGAVKSLQHRALLSLRRILSQEDH